jgi:NADPH2:quinone reductase
MGGLMRAIRVKQYGGPEVMVQEEVPLPKAGHGEVLVKVEAAGVNFMDIYQREGRYPAPLPFTPGNEAAGIVAEVGPGGAEIAAGDRVAWTGAIGSYAEYAIVPVSRLVNVPGGMEAATAAALMLQGMTAHYLAHSTYPLKDGDSCLIHAAAGGVGLLLVQMAKRRGARVIGTVSTPEKAELARAAGADEVILYTAADFEVAAKRFTGGKGVAVVYDAVGKNTFEKSLASLARRGMLVSYGQSSGPVGPVDPMVLVLHGSLFLTRPSLADYTASREELLQRAGDVLRWAASGELKVRIDSKFPLSEAAEAHRRLAGRETSGKLLLLP